MLDIAIWACHYFLACILILESHWENKPDVLLYILNGILKYWGKATKYSQMDFLRKEDVF